MLDEAKKHLGHVHESYFQHLCFAVCFGARLILGGLGAVLHGIFPAVCQTTGSRTVFALHDELKARMGGHGDHHHG